MLPQTGCTDTVFIVNEHLQPSTRRYLCKGCTAVPFRHGRAQKRVSCALAPFLCSGIAIAEMHRGPQKDSTVHDDSEIDRVHGNLAIDSLSR